MQLRSRSRFLLVASGVAWLLATLGCNQERTEARQLLAGVVDAHRQLAPKLAELQSGMAKMKRDIEALTDRVPGGKELREKYFATEEVLGVLDGKMKWLSGEIEEARKSLKKDKLLEIQGAVAGTVKDLGQVGKAAVEILHEKGRLERVAALLQTPERFTAYKRVLPNGFAITGADDGVEAKLLTFIEDPKQKVDATTWFDFDRLFFLRGSADIDIQTSRLQLDNVSQILMSYPKVKLEIGGFTDDSGVAAADKKRSQERAQAVAAALAQMKVPAARMRAVGFGARSPRCSGDDTETCRAQNRRVAVRVTAK